MFSQITKDIAELYTKRHGGLRNSIFDGKLYSNYGYWPRPDMPIEEACNALTDLVAQAAQLGPEDRVLEVGCGYGAGTVYYTKRYRPASVVGLDVTPIRLEEARTHIAKEGLAHVIQVGLGDATALTQEPASFTKVLGVECAFHFNTRRDFFREAARVLVPGGRLALTDVIPRRGVDPAAYLASVYPVGTNPDMNVADNACDADVYADHLRDAGFTEIRIEPITEQTLRGYCSYLERLCPEIEGERGQLLRRLVGVYQEQVREGIVEYVLVAACKPLA